MRGGEGATALLMFANVFLILCAYYFMKPLREGWISISDFGGLTKTEVKAYSSFGQGVLLIPIVWFYGRLSDRWSRSTLITRSTLFCMSNMVIFWALQPKLFFETIPVSGIFFYLWVGIFGVFVVAQFWAFAADLYETDAGDRLLPLIAIGATSGAVAGSWLTQRLVSSNLFGTEWLLIVALLPLTASIALTRWVDRREPLRAVPEDADAPTSGEERDRKGAIALVLDNRFLLAVAGLTLLLSWVNTNGENLLFRVVQEALASEAVDQGVAAGDELAIFTRNGTTAFYGDFYFWVNGLALLLQAFAASRILKYGGFGALLLMMPLIALVSYWAMAVIPILAVVKAMKIAENATDYSISNTARHVLWLPTSREMKYKAKPAIDSFFVRAGDGLAALTVLAGVHAVTLTTQGFAILNVVLVLVWLAFAGIVLREHRKLEAAQA